MQLRKCEAKDSARQAPLNRTCCSRVVARSSSRPRSSCSTPVLFLQDPVTAQSQDLVLPQSLQKVMHDKVSSARHLASDSTALQQLKSAGKPAQSCRLGDRSKQLTKAARAQALTSCWATPPTTCRGLGWQST